MSILLRCSLLPLAETLNLSGKISLEFRCHILGNNESGIDISLPFPSYLKARFVT